MIFAATLGIETDRYLQKCSLISPASALIAQGTGAAAIEEWCDEICKNFSVGKSADASSSAVQSGLRRPFAVNPKRYNIGS
ncbi:MAG: hypothetical protein L6V93_11835 [Clostridiales bacterium]|nr:MAG: hypothetical protein L6V93_11835 [Clostridiales bacterium]